MHKREAIRNALLLLTIAFSSSPTVACTSSHPDNENNRVSITACIAGGTPDGRCTSSDTPPRNNLEIAVVDIVEKELAEPQSTDSSGKVEFVMKFPRNGTLFLRIAHTIIGNDGQFLCPQKEPYVELSPDGKNRKIEVEFANSNCQLPEPAPLPLPFST